MAYRRLACAMLIHARLAKPSHWREGVEPDLVRRIANSLHLRIWAQPEDEFRRARKRDSVVDMLSTAAWSTAATMDNAVGAAATVAAAAVVGLRGNAVGPAATVVKPVVAAGAVAGMSGVAVAPIAAGAACVGGSGGAMLAMISLGLGEGDETTAETLGCLATGGVYGAGAGAAPVAAGAIVGSTVISVASAAASATLSTAGVAATAVVAAPVVSTVAVAAGVAIRFGSESETGRSLQSFANAYWQEPEPEPDAERDLQVPEGATSAPQLPQHHAREVAKEEEVGNLPPPDYPPPPPPLPGGEPALLLGSRTLGFMYANAWGTCADADAPTEPKGTTRLYKTTSK
eukprot:COSAG02_NODE_116_length_35392_cov_302.150001_21_plen_345_part_00